MRRIIQALFITSSLALSFSAFAECEKCHEKTANKAACCSKDKKSKHAECKECKGGKDGAKCEQCCKDGVCKHEKQEKQASADHVHTTAASAAQPAAQ